MGIHTSRIAASIIIVGIGLALASGCSFMPKKKPPKGIDLSEAAEEAKKAPEDQEPLKPKYEPPPEPTPLDPDTLVVGEYELAPMPVAETDSLAPLEPELVGDEPESDRRFHGGPIAGGGFYSGNDFDGFWMIGAHFGSHKTNGRFHSGINLWLGSPNLSDQSEVVESFEDELELGLDIDFRYYFTPRHTFTGIYATGGVRAGILAWRYTNGIQIEEDDGVRTVSSDWIDFYGIYAGIGFSLVQTELFKLGVNLTGGGRVFSNSTYEGLSNDIIGNHGFVQLMFPIIFGDFTGN